MGGEQISQDGEVGSLAPCAVNNDYVAAEFIYSTVHVCHEDPLGHVSLCAVGI